MNKLFTGKQEVLDEVKEKVSKSPFFKNQEIPNYRLMECYNFIVNREKCLGCKGVKDCTQDTLGYFPVIHEQKIAYKACDYMNTEIKKQKSNELITTLYLPKKILSANLEDFKLETDERLAAFKYVTSFLTSLEAKKFKKAMYLYGPFGNGKTYLLAAIANELSKRGYKSLLIYFPDLVRDIKSSIGDGSLEKKINMLKTIDFLMLDDVGSEMMTPWVRDEILGPILQYRLLDELPTFFSSNLSMTEYAKMLSTTSKDAREDTDSRGPRIVERIYNMAKEFKM